MLINPVKGTHDLVDNEAQFYSSVELIAKYIAVSYRYNYIITPIIEHTNLFQRSVGESSDIVNKEMYTFLDKGGRSLTLRPEITAGVMRSIVSNKLYVNEDLPLRYYYFGPCFRYERPQAGRYRQFYQYGVELVGAKTLYEDVEVIIVGLSFLQNILNDDVTLLINTLGDEETRDNYRKALRDYFKDHLENMCDDCKRRFETNPLRILDCKVKEDQEIVKNAPRIRDYLSKEAKERFEKTLEVLDAMQIKYEIDDNLVRGLDYYTGIVFEFHSKNKPEIGAIGGGGHYKNLLKEVGGPDLEGVGFSVGFERLCETFKSLHNGDLLVNKPTVDYYITCLSEKCFTMGFSLAISLRKMGFITEYSNEIRSFKSFFKGAEKKKAKFAIIIGEEELENKTLKVKNLKTQEQTDVAYADASTVLISLVEEYESEERKELENERKD